MYTSYSTLQRKQLSKQVYTDTQSTYLLVYAPGRHKALQAALQNQLHRKFRLVTRLEDELTPRCSRGAAGKRGCGVHPHRPDLFCRRPAGAQTFRSATPPLALTAPPPCT